MLDKSTIAKTNTGCSVPIAETIAICVLAAAARNARAAPIEQLCAKSIIGKLLVVVAKFRRTCLLAIGVIKTEEVNMLRSTKVSQYGMFSTTYLFDTSTIASTKAPSIINQNACVSLNRFFVFSIPNNTAPTIAIIIAKYLMRVSCSPRNILDMTATNAGKM